MTSSPQPTRDVVDAMRDWLVSYYESRGFAALAVRARRGHEDHALPRLVNAWYPGGVSAFIRDHEGEVPDER